MWQAWKWDIDEALFISLNKVPVNWLGLANNAARQSVLNWSGKTVLLSDEYILFFINK